MPRSIFASIGLFVVAMAVALAHLVTLFQYVAHDLPHHRPWIGYLAMVPLIGFDLGMAAVAALAAVTLFLGRGAWLTYAASVASALIFPVGTLAMVLTLTLARRHFGWWYRRHLRGRAPSRTLPARHP